MLWEQGDRYFTYSCFDMAAMERHPHFIEKVDERWVVSPTDVYYAFHSGSWLRTWTPLAIVWWFMEAVVVLGLWIYRLSAHVRSGMYADDG